MKTMLIAVLATISLTACSKENDLPNLPDLNTVRVNLAFTCTHEANKLPPLNPEADQLFQYGRYLQTRKGPKDYDAVLRYYRVAAAYGHYKANHNAQLLVTGGLAESPYPQREAVEWATQLVERNIPMGYYDAGHYMRLGYGFKQNEDMALRYIRKAADMGNADAQYYVGKLLAPSDRAPDIARQMRRCAAEQGHGEAAVELGIDFQVEKRYQEATEAFQMGTAAGNGISASFLEDAFKAPPPTEELNYLALPNDPERSRRYGLILKFFDRHGLRNPKVPDIDQIVPLPPAKLPPWDGTFAWEKALENIPPQPSDALIERLAKAKNLDPATGLVIPPPLKFALGTCVKTGECCPESGLWRAFHLSSAYAFDDSPRHFNTGETMPRYVFMLPRAFALLDWLWGPEIVEAAVRWRLVAHVEQDAA